jgi:hypothetical protein
MMKTPRLLLIFTLSLLIIIPGLSVQVHHEAANDLEETRIVPVEFDVEHQDEYQISTVLDAPIRVTNLEGAYDGFNLFLLGKWNTTSSIIQYYLVITDMDGESIVEKYIGNNYFAACAEFINSTTVLLGTDQGAALWNYYDDTMVYLNISGHHEYEYNPNDNTFFTLNYYTIEIDEILYQFDYINEYNVNGDLVWSLDTRDFISHTQWCPYHDMYGDARDITHSNTVFYDAEEDVIYYNSRNTNTFYKIDHGSSTVEWGLGEYGDFALFDKYGTPKDELFYHAHCVEIIDENKFILFDNDRHNQENPTSRRSRMVEIDIDLDSMTANESWVWKAPTDYWAVRYGDADRLPNGNRLGAFGTESHPYSDLSARLVEVDESGSIVWEMSFEKPADLQFIVIRLERVRFEPTLSSPDDAYTSGSQDVEVTWSALYNFRSKVAVNGTYILYHNDTVYDSGTITYDHLWRPKDITLNVGLLPLGTHELTLSVSDESGHFTNDSVSVLVSDFYIEREGPTEIEYGLPDANISWMGVSNETLSGNITLNGILYSEFTWNGSQPIVQDLESLAVDRYEVEMRLYSGSSLVFIDSFWLNVYSREAPEISTSHVNTTLLWNTSMVLTWDLFDRSPSEVSLFLDNTLTYSTSWPEGNFQLNWSIPLLDEGLYRVTIEVQDVFNLETISQLWITILPPDFPVIVTSPLNRTINWGRDDVSFNWEVHGGTQWQVLKNGTETYLGTVNGPDIQISIQNWQHEGWRLGTYNLTFVLSNANYSAVVTSWITVIFNIGDPYADAIIESQSYFYMSGSNSLDAPDNQYTTIYQEYSNGILTLDMGLHEEILDGDGVDFKVVAIGGTYKVSVAHDIEDLFTFVDYASGNSTFELSGTGIASVRYVQIEYYSGDLIELDAVVAFNYEIQTTDSGPPIIQGPPDIEVFQGINSAVLEWNASDATPWGYTILLNGGEIFTEPWSGGSIVYTFTPQSAGEWNVTIIVEDLFGNTAADTVIVTSTPSTVFFGLVALIAAPAGIVAIVVVYYLKKRRLGTDS